ncbi:MAG TPA: hypothetical protein VNZ44_04950 [Pyrinomonadaceae bacterium]|nr:hypothetical protein [Pyrinomonadaceae bacterium]
MLTSEANRLAVGPYAKAVRLALLRLGMRRCSVRLVRYQCEQNPLRPDWYGLFWRWFKALWQAHRSGAEFLYEDFCSRVEELRRADTTSHSDWYAQIAECAREQGEALQAAILRRDPAAIRRELSESIAAERRLLAMLAEREASAQAA